MNRNLLNQDFKWITGIILFIFTIYSCENDAFNAGKEGKFTFSTDTISFDTIFTTQGTPTYRLVIHNPNNFKINLDSVYLAKNNQNTFILNINGLSGNSARDIGIEAKDSLYIFVQSNVDEHTSSDPLLIMDSLVVVSGMFHADVKLIAVAENVISFNNTHISSMEWTKEKPYLIQGTLTIDENAILKIEKGSRIYFHRNAKMVVNGQLIVDGTLENPVQFKSDRLDQDYDTIPGQWAGIILQGTSQTHIINYALIRNGTTGITAGTSEESGNVGLLLTNTKIVNMGYAALICYHANTVVQNCLLANCSGPVCNLLLGGNHEFTHCTFGNYGARYASSSYASYALILQNYLESTNINGETTYLYHNLEKANFNNCIIYGNATNELLISIKSEATYTYQFENCLIKTASNSTLRSDSQLINCLFSEDPEFKNSYAENFHLEGNSPAIDAGKSAYGLLVPYDLDNQPRTGIPGPDLGAYEYVNP